MKIKQIIIGISTLVLFSCSQDKNEVKEDQSAEADSINVIDAKETSNDYRKQLGAMYIEIPEGLDEISEDKIKLKYPGANRPDYVYGTEDMGVNLCYSVTKTPLKQEELTKYLSSSSQAIASQLGKENMSQSMMDTINGIPFAIIEFYSPTPDEGRIYNLMFTTSLNDQMTIISFNALESRMKDWEQEVSEIFSSITMEK